MDPSADGTIVEEAVALAARWQDRANALTTREEARRGRKLARLVSGGGDKAVLTALIDQGFRSADPGRTADRIRHLLLAHGVPRFFSLSEKLLVHLFLRVGRFVPSLTVPRITARMRADSRHVIISGEREALGAYLAARAQEGFRVNVNHLGEEVLGEEEAAAHMATYLADLRDPRIEGIAVKISTLSPQIHPLPFEETVAAIGEQLARLYREAAAQSFTRPDGTRTAKSVTLDMEAYRDLGLTAQAFMRTLDRPEFHSLFAGMALQAYLPDSFGMLQEITAWARRRVAAGGSPIKIRIVKGANMEMEQLEAALQGWPQAPFDTKRDVDANWKRMAAFVLAPENAAAVRLGAASHNLFDLAYALLLARRNRVEEHLTFEMIEGMANQVRRAVHESGRDFLTYAPVAEERHFLTAVAYLIRRLDENTGPRNFLRHLNGLKTGTPAWRLLAENFRASVRRIPGLPTGPHRHQDRGREVIPRRHGCFHEGAFRNEPNTDWALAANRAWAESIRRRWMKGPGDAPVEVPLVVAGEEIFSGRKALASMDPNQLPLKVTVARCALANAKDVGQAVAAARKDPEGWRDMSAERRHRILSAAANEIRKARGELIGAAAATTGKVFTEADPEVSEAVDFAEFYPHAARAYQRMENLRVRGRGVGVVISPWNFPIAIPCGGIAAALAAGNTVLFKPSSDAILVGWLLCRCFWRAGVSMNTLQFLPCEGEGAGARLTAHPEVDFVILTGGTETALRILKARPGLQLAAETGGKNTFFVSALSDREQAVADVVYSAFGHSGQKCSAASLLILEREVYADEKYRRQLTDAAAAFKAGSAWDFTAKTGPLIRSPRRPLSEALTRLDPGESWALAPRPDADNPQLWSPGIKYGVRPGSLTHLTEFFGPLLGVMCAEDVDQAAEIANGTGYGLTTGIASLDPREQQRWVDRTRAGNLYINRGITGAVVRRQPFGGMGKSAVGAGLKAGGPHYVAQFLAVAETGPPPVGPIEAPHPLLRLAQRWESQLTWGGFGEEADDLRRTIFAIRSYLYQVEHEFGRALDPVNLRGQDNLLRHLPLGTILVRLHPADTLFETLARLAAVRATGNRLRVSLPPGLESPAVRFLYGPEGGRLAGSAPVFQETDAEVAALISKVDRIRYAGPDRVPAEVLAAAAASGFHIARSPVLMEGRLELLHYYRQQCVSINYHRCGNLGFRAADFADA
ncbi:MAG: bifunctional proline dehydrogenase/L-glutamate gamma-semialdehyde dehydrogenase [Desulfobacterales bacterium]|nr:bifunctional proline dehydrogenase/L-glutamate gamma-semialdehyde dehydrogenase [Desulfobacterales bacterium]